MALTAFCAAVSSCSSRCTSWFLLYSQELVLLGMRGLLSTISGPRLSRRLRTNVAFDFAGVTGTVEAGFEAFKFVRMKV